MENHEHLQKRNESLKRICYIVSQVRVLKTKSGIHIKVHKGGKPKTEEK